MWIPVQWSGSWHLNHRAARVNSSLSNTSHSSLLAVISSVVAICELCSHCSMWAVGSSFDSIVCLILTWFNCVCDLILSMFACVYFMISGFGYLCCCVCWGSGGVLDDDQGWCCRSGTMLWCRGELELEVFGMLWSRKCYSFIFYW